MLKKIPRYFVVAIISIGLVFPLAKLSEQVISAQLFGCPPQYTSPILLYGWQRTPIGATPVSVYISTSFSANEKSQIQNALSQWETASALMCLKVNFTETTDPDSQLKIVRVTNAGGTRLQPIDVNFVTHVLLKADLILDIADFDPAATITYNTVILKATLHEIGHSMGLDHILGAEVAGRSVMNGRSGVNDSNNNTPTSIQPCDIQSVNQNPQCATPSPTPTPTPSPTPQIASCPLAVPQLPDGNCIYGYHPDPNGSVYCCPNFISGGCEEYIACGNGMQYNYITCRCARTSPIIVDILGNGYNLTSANDGVSFDFNGDAVTEISAWTSAGSDDAFLVLDRNNNGTVDSGQELFGNFTPQPRIVDPNGFLALGVYDLPENGGNSDGRINQNDAIFPQLRLWQDANHTGFSEPNELHTLPELGLATLDLAYRESRRTDQYGNRFRYRAKVRDANGAQLGRWAWDVYLVTSP